MFSVRVLQIALIMLNECSNVKIEWIVSAALAMCIRNGKSVSTHDIDDDVDNDVRGPD